MTVRAKNRMCNTCLGGISARKPDLSRKLGSAEFNQGTLFVMVIVDGKGHPGTEDMLVMFGLVNLDPYTTSTLQNSRGRESLSIFYEMRQKPEDIRNGLTQRMANPGLPAPSGTFALNGGSSVLALTWWGSARDDWRADRRMPVPHLRGRTQTWAWAVACRGDPGGLLQRRDAGTRPRAGLAQRGVASGGWDAHKHCCPRAGGWAGRAGRAAAQWPPGGAGGPGLPSGPAPPQAASRWRDPSLCRRAARLHAALRSVLGILA